MKTKVNQEIELFIEQFDDNDFNDEGISFSGEFGVFDNSGRCYEWGSKQQCEYFLKKH